MSLHHYLSNMLKSVSCQSDEELSYTSASPACHSYREAGDMEGEMILTALYLGERAINHAGRSYQFFWLEFYHGCWASLPYVFHLKPYHSVQHTQVHIQANFSKVRSAEKIFWKQQAVKSHGLIWSWTRLAYQIFIFIKILLARTHSSHTHHIRSDLWPLIVFLNSCRITK